MVLVRFKSAIILCVVIHFSSKSLQSQEQDEELLHPQWNSIFKPSSDEQNKCANQPFQEETLSGLKTADEECSKNSGKSDTLVPLDEFKKDEVFPVENSPANIISATFKTIRMEPDLKESNENGFSKSPDKNVAVDESQNESEGLKESEIKEFSKNPIALQTPVFSERRPLEKKLPKSLALDMQSFIFNPGAQPQEQFQNCTTASNESGRCRYLQHCMIPSIVSSLDRFMGYVCIIKGLFIGVCCPLNPATIILVKEQDGHNKTTANVNEECGVGKNTRIVGGLNADPKAWPWMVALLKSKNKFYCGGALINDLYVLTAAHCTFDIPNNEITARLGEYDFKDDGNVHNDYAVAEIKRHGHYSSRTLHNDIALLKLEKRVEFNEFIQAICLPEKENSYVGKTAMLAGWGNVAGSVIGGGTTSDILQEANLPVISNEACTAGHGLPMPPLLICTAATDGDKGACNGDSGGPLMLLDENDRWKVIGIVSWGRRGCSPKFPTVYTRVSHFLEWIKKHTKV